MLPFARLREEIQGRARVVSGEIDRELKLRIERYRDDVSSSSESEIECQ